MAIKAIDVSCFQEYVDFKKVKASGIDTVLIRAGYGRESSQKDSWFEEHYKSAKAAGMKIGAYWYSYADSVADAIKEARACFACLGSKVFDLPIYFDIEERWQMSYDMSTLTKIAENFCDTIIQAGYRAGVYASASWFGYCLNYNTLAAKYSIWLAQWASSHSLKCDIWQYTENGNINGVNGNVDMNKIENTNVYKGYQTGTSLNDPTVSVVQVWLNKVYNAHLVVDGIYGNLTRKAIIMGLQRVLNQKFKADLVVDGIFGRATKAAVQPCKRGMYGAYPSILQAFLICRGYDTGGFDGDFGARTESAVKTFQTVKSLRVDGIAGKATFEELTG